MASPDIGLGTTRILLHAFLWRTRPATKMVCSAVCLAVLAKLPFVGAPEFTTTTLGREPSTPTTGQVRLVLFPRARFPQDSWIAKSQSEWIQILQPIQGGGGY